MKPKNRGRRKKKREKKAHRNLLRSFRIQRWIISIHFRLDPQPLQYLRFHCSIRNGFINAFGIPRFDQFHKLLRILAEFALGHEFPKMYSPTQRLQAIHIRCSGRSVILLCIATILFSFACRADAWEYGVDVAGLEIIVDIDIVVP